MQKKILRSVAAPAALLIALSLAACGGDDKKDAKDSGSNPFGNSSQTTDSPEPTETPSDDATETPTDEATDEATDEPTEDVETDTPSAGTGKIADYVKLVEAKLPAVKKQMGEMYNDITVTAEGESTLVYTYIFANELPAGTESALSASEDTLKSASKMEGSAMSALGVKDPKIKYVYKNPGGDIIWETTIDAS